MKVVILHDWLTGFRGGERVLEAFCEMFPDAPIYTLIHKKGSTSPIIESREIITSFMDRIPGIHENYRKFLPLMPLAAQNIKIKHSADLVISSSHCVIKGIKKPDGAKHICYIHSPMRYIYDQFESYFSKAPFPIKLAAHFVRPYLQFWDRISNENVDFFVANSNFVKERVHCYYRRNAKVIHPFVDLKDFSAVQADQPIKENYYLMVTAFAPNKRVDLAIKTFNELGEDFQLRIIGSGSTEETAKLKIMAKKNIVFLGNLNRQDVINAMAKAKAFIFPGIEDFGITPLESLAAGTTVLAYKEGGVLDTLTDETSIFFGEDLPSLKETILNYDMGQFHSHKHFKRANDFSKLIFTQKFHKFVYEVLHNHKHI